MDPPPEHLIHAQREKENLAMTALKKLAPLLSKASLALARVAAASAPAALPATPLVALASTRVGALSKLLLLGPK